MIKDADAKRQFMECSHEELATIALTLMRQRDVYEYQLCSLRQSLVDWLQSPDEPNVHKETITKMKIALFGQ